MGALAYEGDLLEGVARGVAVARHGVAMVDETSPPVVGAIVRRDYRIPQTFNGGGAEFHVNVALLAGCVWQANL
jgi:hypothetical protein